jgi:hypothetical protein
MNRFTGTAAAALCGPAAVLVFVTSAGAAVATAGQRAAARPAAATRQPAVAFDCHGRHQGQVRPAETIIDCLSLGVLVKSPSWKYWTASSARTKTATLWVDNCKPDCATGSFQKYPATLVLYRPRTAHGTRYFTRMRLQYRHNGPRMYTFRWGTYPGATLPGWIGGP